VSTVKTQVGRFVWHELMSTDVERAKSFYTELLGWEIEVYKPGEIDYPMISAGGATHGGFWQQQAPGAPSHWLGHVCVEDVDGAANRAQGLGGTVLNGPMDMPEVGRFALLQDTHGAVFSAYRPEGDGSASEGVFLWDELMSPDVEGSKSFYTEVFGWTASDMDMGDLGIYTIFNRDEETQVAGLLSKPEGMPGPAVWVPYIGADDVEATVARAQELGANALVSGMDVPGVGKIAILMDPTGAVFGLFKPNVG
jgi:predicted enzyme related to lactoylglutathione lyase